MSNTSWSLLPKLGKPFRPELHQASAPISDKKLLPYCIGGVSYLLPGDRGAMTGPFTQAVTGNRIVVYSFILLPFGLKLS